jgi:GDPmannose 4,6-dehydratase
MAFQEVGLNWESCVVVNERFYRPIDVNELRGDASKARQRLGWKPEVTFEQLVSMMVKAELEGMRQSSG